MKIKKFVILSLFLALSFSVLHDFAFALLDQDHCNTTEYVSETEMPTAHGDVCDVHYKFHQAIYLPAQAIILPKVEIEHLELALIDESYYFNNPLEFYKPPIS